MNVLKKFFFFLKNMVMMFLSFANISVTVNGTLTNSKLYILYLQIHKRLKNILYMKHFHLFSLLRLDCACSKCLRKCVCQAHGERDSQVFLCTG